MRRLLFMLLALLLTAAMAGCGDDDEETTSTTADDTTPATDEPGVFDQADFDITFEYPTGFEPLEDISFNRSAGSSAVATAGVGLDETNLLAVQRFDLNTEVTKDTIDDVRPEADMLFSELAGEDVKGKDVTVGGLPALQYDITLSDPPDAETKATAIFDGRTQYLLNCQATPEEAAAVEEACDMALDTLETK